MAPSAEAVAVLANMAVSALVTHGEGHREDHVGTPEPDGDRLHTPVEPGPGAQQHRVNRPPVCTGRRGGPARMAPVRGRGYRRRPGSVGALCRSPQRVQGSGQPGLFGRGRRHLRPRGVPLGPLVGGPIASVGAGPTDRHAGGRLRWHLRPGQLQRPSPAGIEGDDERGGTAFPGGAAQRCETGRGRAGRAPVPTPCRVRLRRRRPHGHRP